MSCEAQGCVFSCEMTGAIEEKKMVASTFIVLHRCQKLEDDHVFARLDRQGVDAIFYFHIK